MRTRSLIHEIEIQNLSGSGSAGTRGQLVDSFSTVERVQAAIRQIGGDQKVTGRQIDPTATHEVQMHYTDTLTEKSRLKFGSRYFHVLAIENVEERNRWLVIQCREVKT